MSKSAADYAVEFALSVDDHGMDFLREWHKGDVDFCRQWWPEAPPECYLDVDQSPDPTLPTEPDFYVSEQHGQWLIQPGYMGEPDDPAYTWQPAFLKEAAAPEEQDKPLAMSPSNPTMKG